MFDVERQIARWRRKLLFLSSLSRSDVDELEAHLRDEMERLTQSGLSEEAAFNQAVEKLGDSRTLNTEFFKINFWPVWAPRIAFVFLMMFSVSLFLFQCGRRIELERRTAMDEMEYSMGTAGFLEFREKPYRQLIYPPGIDRQRARYFDIYLGKNPYTIMVLAERSHDLLYIDYNGDRDLTNDGSPYVFPHDQEEFAVRFYPGGDSLACAETVLLRKPDTQYAWKREHIFDESGRLSSQFVKFAKLYPDYEGREGTYYFSRRNNLKAGSITLEEISYKIALMDVNINGIYNDDSDLIMIDLNGDGKLLCPDFEENFKLNEIFRIRAKNYRLSEVDRYGRYFEIEETDKEQTFDFLREMEEKFSGSSRNRDSVLALPEDFWTTDFISLLGDTVRMNDLKGKFIFMNFRSGRYLEYSREIGVLKRIGNEFPEEKLTILTFLKTTDPDEAVSQVTEKEIDWPVIPFTEEIESRFDILDIHYLPNIFIFPDGLAIKNARTVHRLFFYERIKNN